MRAFRERNPIRIGIASIAVLGALLLLTFYLKKLPFVANTYALTAEFADAAGLGPDNEVRVAGIKVGRVTDVKLAADRVIVSMDINDGVDIPQDSKAEISLKTILGTKFVTIYATGDAAPYEDGGRIPLAQTSIPFEIYQIANAAVDLLTDVDGAQLNNAFDALADLTVDPNRNLARTVDGAADVLGTLAGKRDAIDTVIQKGREVLETLDQSAPEIQAILQHTNAVMEVLARRRSTVQSLLRNTELLATQLGGLLKEKRPELDSILNDLHATLKIVDASLGQVEEALRVLGPSTEAFARIAYNGRWASICTMALRASLLPSPLSAEIDIGTGTAGGPNGPVDCGNLPGSGSTSARSGAGSGASMRGGVRP
jgi:phospholipid/cholesterol/gamma-HCH transport system substrate-binding protein